MKRFLFGNVFLAAILFTIAYFAVAQVVPTPALIAGLNGASLGAAVIVAIVYTPLFWRSMNKVESRVGILAIGLGCLFANIIGRTLFSTYFRATDQVSLMPNHVFVGFLALVGCVGLILIGVAPGYPPEGFAGRFGGRYRWLVFTALFVGTIVSLALTLNGFSVL